MFDIGWSELLRHRRRRADRHRPEGTARRAAHARPVDGQDPPHGGGIPGPVPGSDARSRDGRPEEAGRRHDRAGAELRQFRSASARFARRSRARSSRSRARSPTSRRGRRAGTTAAASRRPTADRACRARLRPTTAAGSRAAAPTAPVAAPPSRKPPRPTPPSAMASRA